jgi:hypothetical protein
MSRRKRGREEESRGREEEIRIPKLERLGKVPRLFEGCQIQKSNCSNNHFVRLRGETEMYITDLKQPLGLRVVTAREEGE